MRTKTIRIFIHSAGVLLLAMATVLFVGNWIDTSFIQPHDPVFSISMRNLFWIVAGGFFAVALLCLFGERAFQQMLWVAWLATNFELYQLSMVYSGSRSLNVYLGSFHEVLGISTGTMGLMTEIVFAYLLIGSYAVLFWLWFGKEGGVALPRSQPVPAEFLKMSCVLCNGHIEFPAKNLGQKIPCPHCKTTITLMSSKNVKTSCPSCGGHIEFPLHGLGQTIACPHCTVPVTLQLPV
jgi:hypothetical protein